MENGNKGNGGLVFIIIILLFIVIALVGFISYDKILNKNSSNSSDVTTNPVTNIEETKDCDEEKNIVKDGECPLYKFDSSYVLTDTDKNQILDSLESLNAGFTRDKIDYNSFKISYVSDNGYYINVGFETNLNSSGTFAVVTKVNNKMKVLTAGSGTTQEESNTRRYTLERICS